MPVELDELQLQLGALGDRSRRSEIGELALGEDDEMVEMRSRLADEEEPPLRQGLQLDQPPRPGPTSALAMVSASSTRYAWLREPAVSARSRRSTSIAADASE